MADWSKGAVFDDQIAPLVAKLATICRREGMPLIVTVVYNHSEKNGDDVHTTIIPVNRSPAEFVQAAFAPLLQVRAGDQESVSGERAVSVKGTVVDRA